jgi:endonuclease/exonuclease/phosphatase family metal-dependent hydrolase
LLTWLGPVGGDRSVVVMGDFNSTAAGGTVKAMKDVLRSAHEVVHGEEPASTHPTALVEVVDTEAAFGVPILPEGRGHAIDYVFVSPSVGVRSCALAFDRPSVDEPRLFPSDHLGLVADLAVRG